MKHAVFLTCLVALFALQGCTQETFTGVWEAKTLNEKPVPEKMFVLTFIDEDTVHVVEETVSGEMAYTATEDGDFQFFSDPDDASKVVKFRWRLDEDGRLVFVGEDTIVFKRQE
jgi:hypothetical protein